METQIIDYAMPLMRVEKLSKETHALCLEGKYEEALAKSVEIAVEARLLRSVLAIMHEFEVKKKIQSRG